MAPVPFSGAHGASPLPATARAHFSWQDCPLQRMLSNTSAWWWPWQMRRSVLHTASVHSSGADALFHQQRPDHVPSGRVAV